MLPAVVLARLPPSRLGRFRIKREPRVFLDVGDDPRRQFFLQVAGIAPIDDPEILVNVAAFRWRFRAALAKDAPLEGARAPAMVSLTCWVLVLLAGRFIAYL